MTIKPGSKYYPLFKHLQRCPEGEHILTFTEIEALLSKPLPASARTNKNWWSNRDSSSSLQANAWVSAGYHIVAVDLPNQTVTFRPFRVTYSIQRRADGEILWQRDAIRALRKHLNLTQYQFAQELGVRRQTISEWENGAYDPDHSKLKFLALVAKQAEFELPPEAVVTETPKTLDES